MARESTREPVQFWMAQVSLGDRSGVVEVIQRPGAKHPELVLLSELVEDEPAGRDAVAVSSGPSDVVRPLECRIAFAANPVLCDQMSAMGFICIEALITLIDDVLKVRAGAHVPGQRQLDHEHTWLTVTGVSFEVGGTNKTLRCDYHQVLTSPDLVLPVEYVRMVPIEWKLTRRDVIQSEAPAATKVTIATLRWPQTLPMTETAATDVWRGRVDDMWAESTKGDARRERRAVEFASYRSRFRKVEVLGARLEVPRYDARRRYRTGPDRQGQQEDEYYRLIAPLNFHLPKTPKKDRGSNEDPPEREEPPAPVGSRPDFYYRPASSGITIELLRYGKMSIAESIGGMESDDFQTQHELLVRTVVGRVDEDASQAQEVATYVPIIFVDNTWSKYMGRQYMGLNKQLAYFCARERGDEVCGPLSPSQAYYECDPPAPDLARIAEIRLARGVYPTGPAQLPDGADPATKATFEKEKAWADETRQKLLDGAPLLLSIDCDSDVIDGWDDFRAVPTDAVLRNSPLAGRRWRQEDFDDADVRRDFARAAGQGSAGSFVGTQSSPLVLDEDDKDRWASQAWITARYSMTGSATMARPRGLIRVTLHREGGDFVPAWKALCNLFEVPQRYRNADGELVGGTRTFALGPGSWYRLKYDMEVTMENGFG